MSTSLSVSPAGLPLSVGQLFDRSWAAIKNMLPLTAGLSLVMFVALGATEKMPMLGWFLQGFLSTGYIACMLRVRRGENFEFADFLWAFQNFNRVLNVLLLMVLTWFAIVAGCILLVVPGVWIGVALSLGTVLQVQGDRDAIEALKTSYALVKGNWWRVFGVLAFVVGLNILGALCFVIGLLISFPLSCLIMIELTEDLQRSQGVAPGAPPPTGTPSSFQVNPS